MLGENDPSEIFLAEAPTLFLPISVQSAGVIVPKIMPVNANKIDILFCRLGGN
jgi:hypothetical protein